MSGGFYISAPGKLILFGEHAVVYDKTAIAGSIDLRTHVSVLPSADGSIHLSLPDLQVDQKWLLKDLLAVIDLAAVHPEEDEPPSMDVILPIARQLAGICSVQPSVQEQAIMVFSYFLLGVIQRKRDFFPVSVSVRSDLPTGVGLGSSGAYCVSLAASLLLTAGLISAPYVVVGDDGSLTWKAKDLDCIRRWATAAESIIHGRTSGLDTAMCTHGGLAIFNKKTGIEHLENVPNLHIILVNSKVERNTSLLVENVRKQKEKSPAVMDSLFNGMDVISKEAAKILNKPMEECEDEQEDTPGRSTAVSMLNDLCQFNHHLLNAIGVGHAKIEQVCSSLSWHGIHAKITGAGGGGCVFAFLEKNISRALLDKIKSELTELDCEVYQPCLGGVGVVLHKTSPEVFKTSSTTDISTTKTSNS